MAEIMKKVKRAVVPRAKRQLVTFALSLLCSAFAVGYSMYIDHRIPPELCYMTPCSLRAEWGCEGCETHHAYRSMGTGAQVTTAPGGRYP